MIVKRLCGEENVHYTKVKKALSIVIVRVFLFNAFFESEHDYVNKLLACVYLYVFICRPAQESVQRTSSVLYVRASLLVHIPQRNVMTSVAM